MIKTQERSRDKLNCQEIVKTLSDLTGCKGIYDYYYKSVYLGDDRTGQDSNQKMPLTLSNIVKGVTNP